MKKLLILLILSSCVSSNQKLQVKNFNFSSDLSFKDFNELLIKYSNENPYPNID